MKKSSKWIYIIIIIVFHTLLLKGQWISQKGSLPSFLGGLKIDSCDSLTAVVALSPSMILRSLDGGKVWSKIGSYSAIDISMVDSSHIWIGTLQGDIMSTTNGGIEWIRQFHDPTITTYIIYIKMFSLGSGVAVGEGLTGTLPLVVLQTNDGGIHWTSVNDSAFGGYSADAWRRLQFSSHSTGYVWPYGKDISSLWKTIDGGVTWNNLHVPGNLQVLRFYDDTFGIACFNNAPTTTGLSIRRTIDGGNTWEVLVPIFNGFWGTDFEFCPNDAKKIWFTDNQKLFFSVDSGRSWDENFLIKGTDIIFTDSLNGWVIGNNDIIHTQNGGLLSIHESDNSNPLKTSYMLFQNYPNPFNPTTTIKYSLLQDGVVQLRVYDMLGRLVNELENKTKRSGDYSVEFNADKLSSGIYFYKLNYGNNIQVKRMVFLR
ncbi:MAG: T9SS type A sorting domain-containing protein [Bacteroidota bacterium]